MSNIPGRDWFSGLKTFQDKITPDPIYQPDDGMNYWREQIFIRVITTILIGAVFIIGLLVILDVPIQYQAILVADIIAIATGFTAAYARRLGLRVRIHIFMIILFSLGFAIQLIGGPIGNGNLILFIFPIMAALLLGSRDAVRALALNAIAMTILSILLHFGLLEETGMAQYTVKDWIANSVGLLFFDGLAAFSLATLLEGLETSFRHINLTQTALQNSQEHYQTIIEDQLELIDRWLPDGTLTFVNQAAADYSGIPREELVGKNFFSFLPEEDQLYLKERLKTLTPTDPVVTIEEAVNIKGRTKWMRWTNRALFNEDGEIREFQSVGSDITERKRAEENLERSETRYRAIVETQTEIISRWRPDTTLTFVNDAGCRFYNKAREELLQTSIIDLAPQDEKQKLRDYIASFSIDNLSQTIQLSGSDKDGNIHWFEWRDTALIEEGRIVEFQSVGRDITEEKVIRDELLKSETRYRAVIEDQVELIGRLSPDGKISFFNHAFANFYGLNPDENFGISVFDLIETEEAEKLIHEFNQLSPENPIYSNTYLETNTHGENRWYTWTNHGIFDALGNLIEIQVIGQDVHEQRLAEQALQDSEARYRAVVEDQVELITRLLPNGTIKFTNHAYARFFGMVPEDLIDGNLADIVGEEEADKILEHLNLLTLQNPTYIHTFLETNIDGENRWFRWTNRGIFDSNEQLQEIQAIGQDIHERKLAEKALQASETLYRSVVEDQLELICRALPDGTYTFTNHAYASFYGSTPDELIGRNVSEVLATDIIKNIDEDHALLTPQNPTRQRNNLTTNAKGEIRWFTWTDLGIFDEEGNLIEIQGIGRDIHEQILAEQALLESEARYRAIIEDQVELICRFLPDCTMTFVNHAFTRFFGWSAKDLIGSNLVKIIEQEAVDDLIEKIKDLTPENPTILNTHLATSGTNKKHWFTWTDRGIFNDQGILVEIQAIGHDIHDRKLAEQALQESETRYRAVVEDQVEMICRILPGGAYTFVNNAYARFYGKTPEELIGRNVQEIIPPDIAESSMKNSLKLTPEEPLFQKINFETNAKGENRWFSWTDHGIFDENGNLIEIQAIGRDIHEQILAEQALQESEARYRAVIEDQTELICRVLPDSTITFVNHAFARFFGWTPEDLIGTRLAKIVDQETIANTSEKIKHLTPENPTIYNTHLVTSGTFEQRWFSWTNHGIFNEEGKLVEVQAIGHDIHDRLLAEQALQESEARYRAIVQNQIEPVCRWRPDYTLTFVNDAYCQLFGISRDELLGQSFKSTIPDEDWMIVEQMVLDLKTGAASAVDENRVYTADGVRWLQWALSAIKADDGKIIEFQSVGHDVSQQKSTQQMLEKTLSDQISLSKANSELAERLEGLYLTDVDRHEAQLGHLANELHDDVLNALAVVSTNLDPDETPQHVIHAYEQAIQRTREIVNGLRTAMLNYGLYIGLETLADELADQLPDGPLIYIDVPHTIIRYEPNVELHLFRIVQEACNNAIKHANPTEIHIRGELQTDQVFLEITDNGSGFDADSILDLPDLLRRKHFGLAGMFERAELIHGQLSIHAAPQEGSCVRVMWHTDKPDI
jgi:PAS domain S-box-containing protein